MAKQKAIKRGLTYRGWAGALPGALVILFLIFLPGFMGIIDALSGFGEIPKASAPATGEGSFAVPRAVVAGFAGGVCACVAGMAIGWVIAGSRLKLLALIPLCLPAVIGEAGAASAFGTLIGPGIETAFPLNGFITYILYEIWRLVGPMSVVATYIVEHRGGRSVPPDMPFAHRLSAGWRRWRIFAGASVFAAIVVAVMGAGHIPVADIPGPLVPLIGPAEPVWRNPALRAAAAWAALTSPLFIIANVIFLNFALRLPGVVKPGIRH